MDRESVSIGARLWQIPSLEGQHAALSLARVRLTELGKTLCAKYGVLGWVFRFKEVDVRMYWMRESQPVQKLALTGISRPPRRPTPPHLSSNEDTPQPFNIHAFQDPWSVVTLPRGYLARQWWFSNNFLIEHFWWFRHTLFLITIFLITNSSLSAQSPYTGGSGDGHAMGELVLRQVSVGGLSAESGYAIYPSLAKPNEAIYITCPTVGEFVLVDLTGRTVIQQIFSQPINQLPIIVTGAGSYIGILRTADGTFTQKIIVIE